MHLQVSSTLTTSSTGGSLGAMNSMEMRGAVTNTKPGLLIRLLELLAEDRSQEAEGHGPFNLVVTAGWGIETTGTFRFSVQADEDKDLEEHQAALVRIQDEFPDSEVIERIDGLVPNKPGALLDWLQKTSDRGYLIDEIVVGIPDPATPDMVPVQISVINPGNAS